MEPDLLMCGIVALFSRGAPIAADRGARHAEPSSPRPRRAAPLDLARPPRRPRPRPAQHHRPGDRRSADRQRGRADLGSSSTASSTTSSASERELEAGGHRLRTRSDSEIALHLYEDLGAQCLHRLRGEFAFVLWDETQPDAVRRARPLRHQAAVLRRPRRHALPRLRGQGAVRRRRAGALGRRVASSTPSTTAAHQVRTLFEGVYQVPPGHYLLATDRHVQLHRYWDFDYPPREVAPRRAPTPSTRPSSGTCSTRRSACACAPTCRSAATSAAASTPARCWALRPGTIRDPIRAFTLTFDRAEYDEEAQAREMAARAGAEFIPIPIRQDDLADHFADAILQSETLCFNAHGVAKYLLSRAVRDAGYKVVLTGEGSDEILGGYPHFRRDMLLYNREGQDPGAVARPARGAGTRATPSRAACCCPDGDTRPLDERRAASGLRALLDRDLLRPRPRRCALFAADFLERLRATARATARSSTSSTCAASLPAASRCTSRCTCGRRPCCPSYML